METTSRVIALNKNCAEVIWISLQESSFALTGVLWVVQPHSEVPSWHYEPIKFCSDLPIQPFLHHKENKQHILGTSRQTFLCYLRITIAGGKKHMLECQFQLMWPQEILGLLIVYCCGPLMLYKSSDRESFWHAAWRAGAVSSNPKSSPTLQYCKLPYSLFNQINVFL